MELLIGLLLGVMTVLILLAALSASRRRARKPAAPPRPTGRGRPSGDREPRRPLVPAGSAAATAEPEQELETRQIAVAIREMRRMQRPGSRERTRVLRARLEEQQRVAGEA